MRRLKYVEQLDQYGCSIACLSMIIGKSYFQTREWLYKKGISKCIVDPQNIGIYEQSFPNILLKYFKIKSNWIKFKSLSSLKNNCIMFVVPKIPCPPFVRHCIIYCAVNKKILDPAKHFKEKSNLPDCNVAYCLEIL